MMNYILIGLLDRAIPEFLDEHCNIVNEDSKKTYKVTEDILSHIALLDQRHLEAANENITFMDYSANTYPAAVNCDPSLVILDDYY